MIPKKWSFYFTGINIELYKLFQNKKQIYNNSGTYYKENKGY